VKQLVKAREGKPGLGQCARGRHHRDTAMERTFLGCREQGRLADPCLATNDERAALLLDPVDERVEPRQLSIASEKQP